MSARIQQIYIAMFGRPADPLGLNFWNAQTNNGANLAPIVNALAGTAEYQARFAGQSNVQLVNSIYQSLFGRDADVAGLTFFTNQLASGAMNLGTIAINILDGAQGTDKSRIDNKVTAATAFTAAIDTTAEILAYNSAAVPAAQAFLAGITDVATTIPNAAATNAAIAAIVGNNSGVVGQTITLTTGVDNVVGTSGNETVLGLIGTNATLSAADVINGGTGTDTLKITYANAGGAVDGFAGALVSNIELVDVRNTNATGGNGVTIAATGLQGVSASGAGDVTVTALGSGATFTANGTTGGAFSVTHADAAAAAALNLVSATTNAVTLAGVGLTTANIKASGAANTTGTITSAVTSLKTWNIDAASNLTTVIDTAGTTGTLNVSGAASKVTVGILDTDFTTVNASGLTAGGLTATMSATATVALTGGKGNDVITTGVALTTGKVDAGDGSDTLIVADSAHLNSKALGDKYTNFETLGVLNGVSVNLDHIAGITKLEITDGAGTTEVTNLSAAQAGSITVKDGNGAATIGVKGAATVGQIDTVKLTFDNGNTTLNEAFAAASQLALAGVENLEVTAVDKAAITQSNANSGALNSVKLFGAGQHTFTTGDMATVNFNLDASASTGANTLDAGAFATNGISIKGGSGVDTITGSAQADVIAGGAGNDIINGGAGNDTIDGGDGNDVITVNVNNSADTITLGAGADIVKFSGAGFADALATSSAVGGVVKITDFVAGTDKIGIVDAGGANTSIVLAAAQTIVTAADLTAVYGGITAIGTSTDGGALSGVVVTVSGGAAAGTYLYINDATGPVSNTDDFLINITGITGTLTAADFVFA